MPALLCACVPMQLCLYASMIPRLRALHFLSSHFQAGKFWLMPYNKTHGILRLSTLSSYPESCMTARNLLPASELASSSRDQTVIVAESKTDAVLSTTKLTLVMQNCTASIRLICSLMLCTCSCFYPRLRGLPYTCDAGLLQSDLADII